MSASHNIDSQTAPWVILPETDITSIEHPCIIKNKSRAIDMLGGPQQLAQSLEEGTKQTLGLTFKPNDPASRTVLSLHNETSNILLKITVPKRTGRKRKRGSDGQYVEDIAAASTARDAAYLVTSLQGNRDKFSVEAVGSIKSCHVWRSMPDFAYFTKASSFLHSIESYVLPQQYLRLKQWSLPRTYGLENTEVVPPPIFSTQSLTHNYTYRQNPAVKTFADPNTGSKILHNKQAPLRLHIQALMFDDLSYPIAPAPDCPPLEEQSDQVQELVRQLQKLFDERPIWTRRAMVNSLPPDSHAQFVKIAAAYVCYNLRSGPWRDAYCKFGVDPRIDPQYRKYQTILLKLAPKDKSAIRTKGLEQRMWTRSPDTKSHIFTGTKAVASDGKTWQMCDLKDAVLKELVDVPELYIRAECEPRYFGWYGNGTSAKLRVLLKAKIDALAEGSEVDPALVESFLQLPDNWTPKAKPSGASEPILGYLSDKSSNKAPEWAAAYRSICRTSGGSLPNYGSNGKGRLSKTKPISRPSYIGPRRDSDLEELEADQADEELEIHAEAVAEYEEPEDEDEDPTADNRDDPEAVVES